MDARHRSTFPGRFSTPCRRSADATHKWEHLEPLTPHGRPMHAPAPEGKGTHHGRRATNAVMWTLTLQALLQFHVLHRETKPLDWAGSLGSGNGLQHTPIKFSKVQCFGVQVDCRRFAFFTGSRRSIFNISLNSALPHVRFKDTFTACKQYISGARESAECRQILALANIMHHSLLSESDRCWLVHDVWQVQICLEQFPQGVAI